MSAPAMDIAHTIPTHPSPDGAHAPLLDALAVLRRWAVPRRVLLIGAGPGTGPWMKHLMSAPAVPVTLVEADALQHERLVQVIQVRALATAAWQVQHALVASTAGEVDFHRLNVASESGVHPADRLTTAWPGMRTLAQSRCSAVTLDSLLLPDQEASDWWVIDCLGGLDLLRHTQHRLDHAQVIGVRALTGLAGQSAPELSSTAAREYLQAQGYRCIVEQAERHPDVERLLFVRDDRSRLHALRHSHVRVSEQRDALARRLEASVASAHVAQVRWQAEREAWTADRHASDARQAETRQAHHREQAILQARCHDLQVQCDALQASHQQGQAEQTALHLNVQQREAELASARAALAAAAQGVIGWQQECAAVRQAAEAQQATWLRRLEAAELVRDAVNAHRATTQQLVDLVHQQGQVLAVVPDRLQLAQQQLADVAARISTDLEAWGQRLGQQGGTTATSITEAVRDLVEQKKAIDQQVLRELEQRLKTSTVGSANNAVKQIEAFLGIQQHFPDGGAGLLDYHGWPISPDIGLFLLERIQSRNYDLIIEFGSGTSTVLFAKAMQQRLPKRRRVTAQSPDERHRIVTFEHQALYRDGTMERLRAQKLDALVDLHLTPLTSWKHGEQDFQYYDCAAVLDQLDRDLSHAAPQRILLFVDGPPGATCADARFPAIPLVFERLGHHQIDVVLDDANRPEEKIVADMWQGYWRNRSVDFETKFFSGEKGIFYARCYSVAGV